MSKKIVSPSEIFTGSVTIADPITIPQAQLIEAGMKQVEGENGRVWLSEIDGNQMPAVLSCVEKWEIVGVPEIVTLDNFPASPRKASHELIEWIYRELLKVYFGEAAIPNE